MENGLARTYTMMTLSSVLWLYSLKSLFVSATKKNLADESSINQLKKVVYIAKYTLPSDLVEASRSHTNPLYSQCLKFRISCLYLKEPYFIHNHFLALLAKPFKNIKFQRRFCKS